MTLVAPDMIMKNKVRKKNEAKLRYFLSKREDAKPANTISKDSSAKPQES